MNAFGMEKTNQPVVRTGFRFPVQQLKPFSFQPPHFGADISYLKSNMVNPLPPFFQEPG